MSPLDPPAASLELLCITGGGGALGLAAGDVLAVGDADEAEEGVPSLDLSTLLGPAARGTSRRRLRVARPGVPPFDLVTDGALSVRTFAATSLVPVPAWLAPLVAPIGAARMWLGDDALVLVADAAKLAALCAPAAQEGARG